jgi:hypothetical protein
VGVTGTSDEDPAQSATTDAVTRFDVLFSGLLPQLYKRAALLVENDGAEDAVHEVYLKLVRNPRRVLEHGQPYAYVIATLVSVVRDDCMRDFGFDYLPNLSTASITQTVRIAQEFNSRWFGISDQTAARTYGYHLPSWVDGTATPQAIKKKPDAETDVFDGSARTYHNRPVPRDGCVGQAAEQLAEAGIGTNTQRSNGDPSTLIGEIQHGDLNRAQSDPRVLAVFAAWAACMDSYGYHYDSPFTAAADRRWAGATASSLEIRTAEDDITCKLRVNLLGVEYAVVSDYQNADIAKNAQALEPVKTQIAQETEALRHLMTRYGT